MSFLTRLSRVTIARAGYILIFVIVAAVVWFGVLAPRIATASALQTQAADIELANLRLLKDLNATRDRLRNAPAAAQQAQELLERMPQTAQLPEVLDQITEAAIDAGIAPNAVSSLSTGIPVPIADPTGLPPEVQLAQMPVSITATGSAASLYRFLGNLEALDRSLLIASTQIADAAGTTGDGGEAASTLQVSGSMFVLESRLPDLVATVERLLADGQGASSPSSATSG
jgi:Tfp pilus assembly protein PilO